MALFLITDAIPNGRLIDAFNWGATVRDFTFIDDIVKPVIHGLEKTTMTNSNFNPMTPDLCSSIAPFRVFNIGNSNPTALIDTRMRYLDVSGWLTF